MPTCKESLKSTYYVKPELHTWMRIQAVLEGTSQNNLVNEALEMLQENRRSSNNRLAHVMATKKTKAVHPAKKGGKK